MARELIFRENNNKYDEPVIEVGHCMKRNDGSEFFSSTLDIMPKERMVYTDCGDSYMDYGISYDIFLAVANKIKELEKKDATRS